MVPKVKDQIGDDSLMNSGTWAYLGSEKKESDRYLFWTSVNMDEIGPGKEIPVIIVTGDGKFYISKSTTAKRTNKCQTYVTIADHVPSQKQYKEYLSSGQEYATLQEAYDAYAALLKQNYSGYTDTLPS